MSNTSIKFNIPTADLLTFSKRLISLVKSDRESIVTFFVNDGKVSITFKVKQAVGGKIDSFYEYVFTNVDTKTLGICSVNAAELAEVISKFPAYSKPNKPHTKELTFSSNKNTLKIKTEMFWNEEATPSKQEITISTVKGVDEDISNILEELEVDSNIVTLDTSSFKEAEDLSTFIRGDVTSKGEHGYLLLSEDGKLVIIGTDLIMASRHEIQELEDKNAVVKGVITRDVLNSIRFFIEGSEEFRLKTFKGAVYIDTGSRRMLAPLLKKEYLIDSSLFMFNYNRVARVDVEPLEHVLSHFINVIKNSYYRTTLQFNNEDNIFTAYAGDNKENNVDRLPAEVEQESKLDVDASNLSSILQRLNRVGPQCEIYVDEDTGHRILLASEGNKTLYLIQGLL